MKSIKEKFFSLIKSTKKLIIKNKHIIFMFLSFFILDLLLRYFTRGINYYPIYKLVPNLFSFIWIYLFISVILSFNNKTSKILYVLILSLSIILFLTHGIYYAYFNSFFDFNALQYAGEASGYMLDAIKKTPIWVIITLIIVIVFATLTFKNIPKKTKKVNYKYLSISIAIFTLFHFITPLLLGKTVDTWDQWRKPRNVYVSFNDNNRSMQLAGFYEYNIRNFYISSLKIENEKNDNEVLLEEKFSEDTSEYKNKYTGMFKDKNVIFVQLESIDNFLITKEIMPTLYSLQNHSINFKNHFSFTSGGGSTFNSEYMINTGYTTPFTSNKGAYTFSKNTYLYSLPNLLKKAGYTVNAFHMNTPEYYSRDLNYRSFGYDSFNSLKSMDNGKYYTDNTYWLDTELINNINFNKLIFNEDNLEQKFASYIITYSAHMPFEVNKGVCSLLVEDHETELNEYECLKLQAKETDNMIKLLMENLKEKNLIDNTIVVFFADHYLYTLNDKTLLDKYKETSNNLINNTAWMIWSNNLKKTNINEVTSQLNILPTMLNILGLEYHPNYYLMPDALNNDYKGIVFFNDYSWYNGKVYVENGLVTNGKNIDEKELIETNELVNKLVKINDAVLTTDYFKNIK